MLLVLHGDRYAICRLPADAELPYAAMAGAFASLTRTADELSLVCSETLVPAAVRDRTSSLQTGYRRLSVAGPLDLSLVGVMASLADPLSAAGIPLFAVATFDTDHLLLHDDDLDRALTVLRAAGHEISSAD